MKLPQFFSPRVLATACALLIGSAATSFAAGPEGSCGVMGGMHGGPGMYGGKGGRGMQELGRLHDELKLDARQEALWQEVRKAGGEGMAGMRENMQKERAEVRAMLDKPGADLRAVMKRVDEQRQERQRRHESLHTAQQERLGALYDSLDANQKEKVRVFFRERLDRMERDHRGPRGGRGTQGDSGRPQQ